MWINLENGRSSLKKKKKIDYPKEKVLKLHEERSSHIFSFDKIKDCGAQTGIEERD